jgi:hypothetical protein
MECKEQTQSIPFLTNIFLFAAKLNEPADDIRESIKTLLPSPLAVRRIADIYYTNAAWM